MECGSGWKTPYWQQPFTIELNRASKKPNSSKHLDETRKAMAIDICRYNPPFELIPYTFLKSNLWINSKYTFHLQDQDEKKGGFCALRKWSETRS
jgi:hypothetical protein